jgi:thiol-disulfide isomerase/thioredoxin
MMRKRSLFFLVAPILALGLVAALLYAVRSAQPTSSAVVAGLPAIAAAPAVPPSTAEPVTKSSASQPARPAARALETAAPLSAAPAQDADLVFRVRGDRLRLERFTLVEGVDAAMSTLLQTEPAEPAQLLEQMVNHALVMQAMRAAGATPAVDAAARLAALLNAHSATEADLAAALTAAGVGRAEFDAYFAELLAVQEFVRTAASAQGAGMDAYITTLQAAADIHYGPAAAVIRSGAAATTVQAASTTAPAPLAPAGATSPRREATLSSTAAAEGATSVGEAAGTAVRGLAVGQLAPDFALPALGGGQEQVAFDDLLGTPVVLSFWTTWCPYCLRQTPVLVAAAERNDAVRFVGVNVAEDAAAVAPYVEQHHIPYTILLDGESRIAAAYAVDGYPATYFLDANGQIVAHHIGALDEQQLAQYVKQLLTPHS